MKARELELCEIQRWYPRFKSLSLKTIILPLPESFIAYLQEDGLFLPRDSEALPARTRSSIADCDEEDYRRWDEEDDETSEPEAPSFPHLEAEVAASIAKLDGSVFPKLNWSAPKDSSWISSTGNLRCTNFGEICLLLKASDTLVHDLSHAYDSCDDKTSHRPHHFFLALRKWYDMRPEMEFRGFVRHGLLVGVSQREVTGFYPALLDSQETLDALCFGFFIDCLSEVFELEDYTFDCYVTRAGKVKLVDFNPWGAFTLPLLFTWEELEDTYAKFEAAFSETFVMSRGMHSIGSYNAGENISGDGFGSSHNGDVTSIAGDEERCASHCPDSDKGFHGGESGDVGGVKDGGGTLTEMVSNDIKDDIKGVVHCYKGVVHRYKGGHSNPVDGVLDDNKDGIKGDVDRNKDADVNPIDEVLNVDEKERARPAVDPPGSVEQSKCSNKDTILRTKNRKKVNIVLREQGFKSEFRIVKSNCHVQVNLRMGGGVPYDYVQTGPGSAWDEFLRRASDEIQQQNKDAAAGG